VGRRPEGGAVGPMKGGDVCMIVIFILKEMWTQDKLYILVGALIG
jgi:hypothetical protein